MINFIEKADCDDKLKKLNKKLPQRFRGWKGTNGSNK